MSTPIHIPGVIHASERARLELSPAEFREKQAAGLIRTVRRDWYVTERAPVAVVLALSLGLRLTCISAAIYYGLWMPERPGVLHGFGGHSRYPDACNVLLHRLPALQSFPDHLPIAPLGLLLEHAARCLPIVSAAILFESALNLQQITRSDVDCIVAGLPRDLRRPLARLSEKAQSGTETKVRWWLEERRIPVRPQVFVLGVGRVDMLVGERLIIECDSAAYHTDPVQYRRDRERDLELIRMGYEVIRLTWEQIMLDWDRTSVALLTKIRTRTHLKPLAV